MYDLEDLYQEIVMDHNRRPRNFGEIKNPTNSANEFNPLCGDQITLQLHLKDGLVSDLAFIGVGCAISKSSASMMTEELKGKTLDHAENLFEAFRKMITRNPGDSYDSDLLGDLEILQGVSRYPARIKCATLAWHTLHSAIHDENNVVSTE
jgi:nitrogen fixation NifU-like protein